MILTVTLNTSIDKLYMLEKLNPYTVMRVQQVRNTAGGKGLNVSRIAAQLGEPVISALSCVHTSLFALPPMARSVPATAPADSAVSRLCRSAYPTPSITARIRCARVFA